MRIEDLDSDRVRAGAAEEAVEVLHWLGLDWDEGPYQQSADLSPYCAALERLRDEGLIYPCSATRKEIERAASAPHESDGETRYSGINRPVGGRYGVTDGTPPVLRDDQYAWRLIVQEGPVAFEDALHGAQAVDVSAQVGDFAVATKAGLPAYQLAVVVDDARQGVTEVVRGEDLLSSTPRQVLLYRMLGLGDPPRYWHLPLVTGPDGRRMAKRDDAVRLTTYRDAGVPGERVVGMLANWAGLADEREAVSAAAFAKRLDPTRLAYDAPRFTEEDERWLMAGKT